MEDRVSKSFRARATISIPFRIEKLLAVLAGILSPELVYASGKRIYRWTS